MSAGQHRQTVIPWMMRRDLEWFPADEDSGAWTLRDPVRLLYFRIQSEELEFLRMLDGRLSLESARRRLMQKCPDLQFDVDNLSTFLITAIRSGLLISVDAGYGQQLAEGGRAARSSAVYRRLFSLISHRFRGIDPTRLLHALDRRCSWMFHRRVLMAAAVFVLLITFLILTRWTQLTAELPTAHELLTFRSVLSLGLIIVFIRFLHELAHGLTCCHYGGECHELGCFVVGFLPLLYCDVSDSWRQQHRVYRMQVAAAGIAVELVMAAVCGLLWMASIPGLLHSLFLNVMLVCSVNTVLINGNPLLRYDGYYVLSDALKLPNLGPQSRMAAAAVFDRCVLGLVPLAGTRTSTAGRIGLPLFGAASALYRLLVLATILLFVNSLLKPYRLEVITWLLALSVAAGMSLAVSDMLRQRWRIIRQSAGRVRRAAAGMAALLIVLGAALFWPFPFSLEAPFTLTPGLNSPVYVAVPGRLQDSLSYGDSAEDGQRLAQLVNHEIALERERLEGELKSREARVVWLTSTRAVSETSALAIPAAEEAVRSTRNRLQTLSNRMAGLTLHSPESGVLYPPRVRPSAVDTHLQQKFWHGGPLDPENHTAWLEEQTLLGWVGSNDRFRATIYVPQQQVEFVEEDSRVVLTFNSQPGQPFSGTVTGIGSQPETELPPELTTTGMMKLKPADGTPADTRFVVHVQLDHSDNPIPPLYSTGFASVECQPMSMAARCWRLLSHTFAFEL